MLKRSRLCAGFFFLWAILVICYYQFNSPSDGSNDMDDDLRVMRAKLKALARENAKLKKEAQEIRQKMQDQVNSQLDELNKELEQAKEAMNAAEMSEGECQKKMSTLQTHIENLRDLQAQGHDYVQGGKHGLIDTPGEGPSLEHETARFKLSNNIQELWYYVKSSLGSVKSDETKRVLENVAQRYRSMKVDLVNLAHVDNNQAWREQEHAELQSLMQRRLHYLQNPKDCSTAKKLVCDLNKSCGFGCQLHHAIYCFMIAYGTERTMILKSHGWRYDARGWEQVFLPMSETCTDVAPGQMAAPWSGEKAAQGMKVVSMPIVDALHARPPYMPLSFPEDLSQRLMTLHGDPSVWFISQFVKYMMRMQPHTEQDFNEVKSKMGFKTPIVGIHVRRTDKVGTEAAYHGIDEYMEHVAEWFLIQERIPGHIDKRRVYIASDDPSVLPNAREKYPDYEFIGDVSIAQSAGMGSRYSDNSLRGVIIDIHMLSLTNYLVCTFSSQVCRVAYEIMQTLHPDASQWFHSLDDIYYFGGQGGHEETALYSHDPENREEIALEPGDIIGIAGNHWDGYSKGQNRRTGGIGLYPSYKTEDKKVIVKYPIYPEVSLTET